MKAQCPAKCGRELGPSFLLCTVCYAELPQRFKDDVARYALLIRQTRNPILLRKYFGQQLQAKERAIQFVNDKQNKQQKVSA